MLPIPSSRHAQEVSVFCLPEVRLVVWFVSQVPLMARWEFQLLFYTHIHWNCCAARTWCVVSELFANPLVGTCLIAFQLLPWAPKFPLKTSSFHFLLQCVFYPKDVQFFEYGHCSRDSLSDFMFRVYVLPDGRSQICGFLWRFHGLSILETNLSLTVARDVAAFWSVQV